VLKVRSRLCEVLDQPLTQIPGWALKLKARHTKEGFVLSPGYYKDKPKFKPQEKTGFSRELKAKVLIAQDKAEYNWSEMRQLVIGVKAQGRQPGARKKLAGLKLID
jgi:hypothetical protein